MTMYKSQAEQDKWVEEITKGKHHGFFVEVGAYDGVVSSNTYYLEQVLGWKGICIEASPHYFQSLVRNRPLSTNVNIAVMPYTGVCSFGDMEVVDVGEPVPCDTLSNILQKCNAPEIIDYVSLDIEGGEIGAIESFDWSAYRINTMTVEHNLYIHGPSQKDDIYRLLTSQGYIRVREDVLCLDPSFYMQPFEDWYAHRDFLNDQK